jgi:hypothetical protein
MPAPVQGVVHRGEDQRNVNLRAARDAVRARRRIGVAQGDVHHREDLVYGHCAIVVAVANARDRALTTGTNLGGNALTRPTRRSAVELIGADRAVGKAEAGPDIAALVKIVHGRCGADRLVAGVDRGAARFERYALRRPAIVGQSRWVEQGSVAGPTPHVPSESRLWPPSGPPSGFLLPQSSKHRVEAAVLGCQVCHAPARGGADGRKHGTEQHLS